MAWGTWDGWCQRCWGTGTEPTIITIYKYQCQKCRGTGRASTSNG